MARVDADPGGHEGGGAEGSDDEVARGRPERQPGGGAPETEEDALAQHQLGDEPAWPADCEQQRELGPASKTAISIVFMTTMPPISSASAAKTTAALRMRRLLVSTRETSPGWLIATVPGRPDPRTPRRRGRCR